MTKVNRTLGQTGLLSLALFVVAAVVLFKTSLFASFDSGVNAFFIGAQNEFTTNLMSMLDIVSGEMIFAGLVILLAFLVFYKNSRKETFLFLSSLFAGGVAVKLFKDMFEVARPNMVIGLSLIHI